MTDTPLVERLRVENDELRKRAEAAEAQFVKLLELVDAKQMANPADCPSFHDHTPAPSGYNQWHDWARKMLRTHKQIRCTGCGLYHIWIPRRPAPISAEKEGE